MCVFVCSGKRGGAGRDVGVCGRAAQRVCRGVKEVEREEET